MSDIRNAKTEFLIMIKDNIVIASNIWFDEYDSDNIDQINMFKLKPLYSIDDYNEFLKFLDREYDSGYGGQKLFGVIYCENGVWMQRGEYDGAEWWDIFKYPDLRDSFDESDVIKYERSEKLKKINNL